MTKNGTRRHFGATASDRTKPRQSRPVTGKKLTGEKFPPLSISRESLLRDGSDREFRRLIYSLVGFAEMIVRHRNMYGAYIGVSGPQYTMMTIIAGTPNMTVGQIAKTISVSDQFVTSEIGKLVKENIVTKTPDEADRRSMLLSLTLKGRSLLRELGPLRRESNNLMYRSLTGERARLLQDIIDTLIADAEVALYELDAPQRRGQKAPTASAQNSAKDVATDPARRRA
jgi:MarR family transcriptional regulator, organic hydroperoxide resistance regulator